MLLRDVCRFRFRFEAFRFRSEAFRFRSAAFRSHYATFRFHYEAFRFRCELFRFGQVYLHRHFAWFFHRKLSNGESVVQRGLFHPKYMIRRSVKNKKLLK